MQHVHGKSALLGQKGAPLGDVPFVSNTHANETHFSNGLSSRYSLTASYLQWHRGNQRIQEFPSHQGHLLSRYSHHDLVSPLILAALDDPVEEKKKMFIYPSVSSFPFPVITQYLDVLTLSSRLGSMGNYDFQRQKQTVPFFNIAAA